MGKHFAPQQSWCWPGPPQLRPREELTDSSFWADVGAKENPIETSEELGAQAEPGRKGPACALALLQPVGFCKDTGLKNEVQWMKENKKETKLWNRGAGRLQSLGLKPLLPFSLAFY